MENKQTAAEWLWEQIDELVPYEGISVSQRFNGILEQAIAMEKDQIVDAHIEGQRVFDTHQHTQWTTDQAELYYNETYGK
jgi:hypothetical protein